MTPELRTAVERLCEAAELVAGHPVRRGAEPMTATIRRDMLREVAAAVREELGPPTPSSPGASPATTAADPTRG
jgi:hypothetical protein